jgi:hypothetical protein
MNSHQQIWAHKRAQGHKPARAKSLILNPLGALGGLGGFFVDIRGVGTGA